MTCCSYAMCFSALQRAENFSMSLILADLSYYAMFQCSSASRKFLNRTGNRFPHLARVVSVLFSEPKISQFRVVRRGCVGDPLFQCSSASRKFLNQKLRIKKLSKTSVSVLFSEPKISQSELSESIFGLPSVSVLFSEPKISQWRRSLPRSRRRTCFSALQRAENFSIRKLPVRR